MIETSGAPSGAPAAAALSVTGLSVRLSGTLIVEDVSFKLMPGEGALLTGPNGAGKSTLLRALVGLLPSSGDVEIAGLYPQTMAARARFVFVPDEPALYEDLTLREHLRFSTMLYQRPEAEERGLELLSRFGLAAKLDEYPGTHSRGMRQKLSLALALGLGMPLTLLDEPFNGLDLEAQELLAGAIRQRRDQGGAVLLTGHQRELGEVLGTRTLELKDGHLSEQS